MTALLRVNFSCIGAVRRRLPDKTESAERDPAASRRLQTGREPSSKDDSLPVSEKAALDPGAFLRAAAVALVAVSV